jgi:hypothetical protein
MRWAVCIVGWLAVLGTGCHNTKKFLVPEEFVSARDRDLDAPLVDVRYASGWMDEPVRDFDAEEFITRDGVVLERSVLISYGGCIEVAPRSSAPTVQVFVRHTGDTERGFVPILETTGAVAGRFPNEVRVFEARPLKSPMRIVMDDLHNVYNDYTVLDGDLLLLEVVDADQTERYLFRNRRFGIRTKFGAGVLFRVPLPVVEQRSEEVSLSPALAASFGLGYRFRSRGRFVSWVSERTTLLATVGVGSTAVEKVLPTAVTPVDQQFSGAFNAALVGGGMEFFGFVSMQTLVNLSSFLRKEQESTWALAVGFDAVAFGIFTRDAGTRLFSKNELHESP